MAVDEVAVAPAVAPVASATEMDRAARGAPAAATEATGANPRGTTRSRCPSPYPMSSAESSSAGVHYITNTDASSNKQC